VSSTTVVTDWAERTAELHRVLMPQKDNLCGAFWGALVLTAAGMDGVDQDLVALESGTLLPDGTIDLVTVTYAVNLITFIRDDDGRETILCGSDSGQCKTPAAGFVAEDVNRIGQVVGHLVNRLRLEALIAEHPEIEDVAIDLRHDAHPLGATVRSEQGAQVFEGGHSGYQRLSDPVVPRRRLELSADGMSLRIVDRFEGSGRHAVSIPVQLAPGWALLGLSKSLAAQKRTTEAAQAQGRFARAWKDADVKIVSTDF